MNEYLSLSEAARTVPGKPHTATLWRWCRRGVKARNGATIRLTHIRAGSRVYTTAEALQEFFAALTTADLAALDHPKPEPPPRPPTSKARAKQIKAAEKVLVDAGIMEEATT